MTTNGYPGTYQYGTFVNGDYWVKTDERGIVNVTRVSPKPENGLNGNMINPPAFKQSFYKSVWGYDANLAVSFPRSLNPGDTLLSTQSINSSHVDTSRDAGDYICNCTYDLIGYCVYNDPSVGCYQHAFVYSGASLTILNFIPSADSFRPAYSQGEKTIYRLSEIENQRDLLLNLEIGSNPSLTRYENEFRYFFFDTMWDAGGRLSRPLRNGLTYGEYFSRYVGDSFILLNSNYSAEDKEKLLINYLQLGIDLYGLYEAGKNWEGSAAHDHARKLPIIFAGVMFNKENMKSINNRFAEIVHSYPGVNSNGDYVPRYGWILEPCTGEYNVISGGCWGIISSSGAKVCDNPRGLYDTCGYQSNTLYAWIGRAIMMKYFYDSNSNKYLKDIFNHSEFFDFSDRWMNNDVAPSYKASATGIGTLTWNKYRYCNSDSDCVNHPLGTHCVSAPCYLEDCSSWNKKECVSS